MKDIKQCVYKYVYHDSIIYIGKTDRSLKTRINGHAKEEKFLKYLTDAKIYFIKLKNKAETSFMETYLINKYKPILNVVDVYDGDSGISICEPEWKEFLENKNDTSVNNSKQKTYNIDKYGYMLNEKLLNRIKKYGLKSKFTIQELIDYYDGIHAALNEVLKFIAPNDIYKITGLNKISTFSSGWFCACDTKQREEVYFGGARYSGTYELDVNRKGCVTLNADELYHRYKDRFFISLSLIEYESRYGRMNL